jgi:hypothetical protein
MFSGILGDENREGSLPHLERLLLMQLVSNSYRALTDANLTVHMKLVAEWKIISNLLGIPSERATVLLAWSHGT